MKSVKVLVVAHKLFDDSIIRDGYQVIKVGSNVSDEEAQKHDYLVDDVGNNISSENPFYCELTAQYWAWKNLNESDAYYIGISHYRRYFFDYSLSSKEFKDDIISKERIISILKKKKAIMSFPTVKYAGYGTLYKNKSDDNQDKHWIIIRDIIKKDYPELEDSFNKVLYGRFTTWGNMIITTKEIFDSYSAWIFEILKKYDRVLEEQGEERIPRVDGFLSEYLLLVWFHKFLKRKEIKYLEVRNTETDSFIDYTDSLKGRIIRILRSNYATLYISRYIRIGYLLIKRRNKQ